MPLLAPVTIAILRWSCPAILYSRSRKYHYTRGHNRLFGCATGRRASARMSSFGTTSALPSKADIVEHDLDVRFVPKADICTAAKKHRYSVGIRGTGVMEYPAL
jgi:hypothetical protein